jgi:hypothetical protein
MSKLTNFALFLISCLGLIYCNDKNQSVDRKLNNISTETFYAIDKHKGNDSLIFTIIEDVTKAFKLEPMHLSKADSEIRIYFISPFGEKFFHQKVINGQSFAKLINCKTIKRGDSLFMKQNGYIEAKEKFDYKDLNTDSIPLFSTWLTDGVEPGTTDFGNIYLIQVKNKSVSKTILIKNPFDIDDESFVVSFSRNLIERINEDFNFHFYDSWNKIIDSAFIKRN